MPLSGKQESLIIRIGSAAILVAALWIRTWPEASQRFPIAVGIAVYGMAVIVAGFISLNKITVSRADLPALNMQAFASPVTKLIIGLLLFGVGSLFYEASICHVITSKYLGVLASGLVAIGFYWTWRGSQVIWLYDSAICCLSLFGGYRCLRYEQIEFAAVLHKTHPLRPTHRLEIAPMKISRSPVVVINLKVFRPTDIRRVFDWLGPKLKTKHAHEKEPG